MAESLYFLSGKRTPFGAHGGKLRDILPSDLGVAAGKSALEQAGVSPAQIDHVIFGAVLASAPDSIYMPRHIGLKLGIPETVPALGVNRLCGSGFQSIIEAYQQFATGDSKIALVGGSEAMSMAPYELRKVRFGAKMGHQPLVDMLLESLFDTYAGAPMAITAENLAEKYSISRDQSDAFALRSQKLCREAKMAGRFTDELVAMPELAEDEHPRPETTLEGLAKLKPVFKKEGVVTAGNASGIVDGAAAMVVASESATRALGVKPLGRLVSYGIVGCDPKIMGIGPAPAAREALKRAGLSLSQMDLIEINEAFAPQTLAVQKELGFSDDILNVNGGAIAIGHPLAASGTRLTMAALYELRRRNKKYGLVSACIGGGQGIAMIIEALK